MVRKPRRQRIRQALLLLSLLLFPITINYFSPYIIIDGAAQGIINGSFIVFAVQFLAALFVGRLWCGWACPAGALGEMAFAINDKPLSGKQGNWIKWAIWVPWIGIIAWAAISAGGYRQVNVLHLTESGVSLDAPERYFIYYIVIGVFLALSLIVGRRAGCHTICWMAPFMILGRNLRNLGGWPALHLNAATANCINCRRCSQVCPMSLDVNGMVQAGAMEHSECILCGSCVDSCPKQVITFGFRNAK